MNAAIGLGPRPRERAGIKAVGRAALLVAGLALLVARPLGALGSIPAEVLLAVGYAALLVASLIVPVAIGEPGRLGRVATTLIGMAALGLVFFLVPRGVPSAFGLWAIPLAVVAAVAEEAFFRRFAYGVCLRFGALVAVAAPALAFAAMHIPLYGASVFWVDLGAGLLFGWQRWASGSWTSPAATHVAANIMAVIR